MQTQKNENGRQNGESYFAFLHRALCTDASEHPMPEGRAAALLALLRAIFFHTSNDLITDGKEKKTWNRKN